MEHSQDVATIETATQLGLLPEEYDQIVKKLGREPNFTELSIFSVMWSEHCCYKNSIIWLKTLPKEGSHILAEAGEENAGLVDIGDGMACAFKIESHNHPSAIEPYQGAATGVGGIHRDIFTMGARPVAALNSLRFGNLDLDKTKWLLKGVVKGIGDYGNSFGVPTVGGELYFDESYNINPLVNAMSVGIVEAGKTASAEAKGIGNPVYIVGSATGKDGIHGAAFASKDITDDSAKDLPAVQVGDPFQEKLLLEASLEAIASGAVVGMQDMGAAGITCSTSEMSEKGGVGMHINLDKVPTRQANMKPFEILLSESQERMLVVVEKGRENDIEAIFDKWDLNCAIIGEVVPEEEGLKYYSNGKVVAHIPAEELVLGGGAPVYERPVREPAYMEKIRAFRIDNVPEPEDLPSIGRRLAGHPNIASRRWVYEQYDSMVQTNNTSTNAASDAAVVRLKGTTKALAVTTDCNPYYIFANPEAGAAIAVAEAARNIVCSGGKPSAITNCLNFGNPLNPEVYYQFTGAVKGMSAACRKFDTPVTGGNVSFYNQSAGGGAVLPTPVIGMIGVLHDYRQKMNLGFRADNDLVYLVGTPHEDISSSQYLIHIIGERYSPAPHFDLDEEYDLQSNIGKLIKDGLIQSAHDVSEGGLFITLLESAMSGNRGLQVTTPGDMRRDAYLFGEAQSRVIVSVKPSGKEAFESLLKEKNQDFSCIGQVGGREIRIDDESWGTLDEFREIYDTSLEKAVEGTVVTGAEPA